MISTSTQSGGCGLAQLEGVVAALCDSSVEWEGGEWEGSRLTAVANQIHLLMDSAIVQSSGTCE